jgi:hypothetical protein
MSRRLLLFCLTVAFSVIVGFFTLRYSPEMAVRFVQRYGYWQILAVSVLFGIVVFRTLRADVIATVREWRTWRGPAAVILLATLFLHVHERHEFKIVMDEVVLQDTAMRMHFDRQVGAVVRGYDLAGVFTALQVYLDKRPLFFPFLVSVLHDLTGYRVANAFALNAGLSVVFMALLFLLARRLAGVAAGLAAVLLAASIPLLHQNVCGSGFELLNMVMILATIWFGMRYAEAPETDRLAAFVLSGILLAQTRYESALFIAPVAAVIVYVWWRQRTIELSWPILIAPLGVIILPLHFTVFVIAKKFAWQMVEHPEVAAPFSLSFVYDNIGHALNFFFTVDGIEPSSILVSIAGLIGVPFFLLTLYREHRELFARHPALMAFVAFALALIVHTGVMLCYFWGQFDDPIIRRLSLPAHLLMILTFVFIWPRLTTFPRRWSAVIVVSLLFVFVYTVPVTAKHRYTQENFAGRTNAWLSDYIESLGDDTVLAIDENSGLQWFIHRKSSIFIDALRTRPEAYAFQFKNRSFKHFFFVQRMGADLETGARFPSITEVVDGLKLEVVEERMYSPVYLVRLSRVVGVDEEALKAWAARPKLPQPPPSVQSAVVKDNAHSLDRWFKMLP